MRTKPTVLRAAIGIALGSFAVTGQANLFAPGTILSIDPGTFDLNGTVDGGSYSIWAGGTFGTTFLEGFDGIQYRCRTAGRHGQSP